MRFLNPYTWPCLEDCSICPANENICIQTRVRYVTARAGVMVVERRPTLGGGGGGDRITAHPETLAAYMISIQIVYAYVRRRPPPPIRLVLNLKFYVFFFYFLFSHCCKKYSNESY